MSKPKNKINLILPTDAIEIDSQESTLDLMAEFYKYFFITCASCGNMNNLAFVYKDRTNQTDKTFVSNKLFTLKCKKCKNIANFYFN